ncbi:TolB protein [Parelusimicrobium proximum]|uniref:hypothetical protein n=1 Tax=Parelusimicrobium proximum TaxID=3228953 RepID=UPI003D162888
MKKILTLLAAVCCLALPVLADETETDVYIGISSKGGAQKPAMIIMPFIPINNPDADTNKIGKEMSEVLRADLMFSRYFNILDTEIKIKEPFSFTKFSEDAKKAGAEYLVYGTIRKNEEKYSVNVYAYHTESEKAIVAKNYALSAAAARRSSHIAADQIVLALTGKRGIADTRLSFANDGTKHKEIYIVDYDGHAPRQITKDRSIALLPRWSIDGSIYYTSYRYKSPDIFRIDLTKGKVEPVSISKGLDLIGGVSPDGRSIVLTKTSGTNPSLFELDLNTKQSRALTSKTSVDGSPSYSPDGKFITFISNKAGNPQVYVMELATGNTRKLTASFNWADSPQWSPTGEWIVFAGRYAPYHPIDLFLVDITGTQIRQLTADSGRNEDPTWSPDGRFIAFTTSRKGRKQLYVMDSDGSAQHLIADIKGNSHTPHWSF